MWTVFCNVLLDRLFAGWYMNKSLPKCCLNFYEAFSLEIFSTTKTCSNFDNWGIVTLNLSKKKVFSNIFISILSTEPSNYDPWKSLLVCQLPNYLINKAIVLSNQQIVKFYENNNLGLCGLQKVSKKLHFMWGGFFWNTLYNRQWFTKDYLLQ